MQIEEALKVNDFNRWILCDEKIQELLDEEPHLKEAVSCKNNTLSVRYVFFKGFLKTVYLYLLQYKISRIQKRSIPEDIVIESLMAHHHHNYFRIFNKRKEKKYLLIKCFVKKDFTKILSIPFSKIYSHFLKNFNELEIFLSGKVSKELKKRIIKNSSNSIAIYSYFSALLENMKEINPSIKIFHGGAPLFSLAAISLKIPTCYLAHGLINKANKLNFPRYYSIYVYSKDEAKELSTIFPKSNINIYPFEKIKSHNNKVICFLDYDDLMKEDELINTKKAIKLFISFDYEIYVKGHPASSGKIASKLAKEFGAKILTKELKAEELLIKERPKFIISAGFSTSICEALNMGIIPIITTYYQGKKGGQYYGSHQKKDWFFNFEKRSLFWTKEVDLIKNLLKNIDDYQKVLALLEKDK